MQLKKGMFLKHMKANLYRRDIEVKWLVRFSRMNLNSQ